MASDSLDAVFPRDHVFYQIQDGSPDQRVIQSRPFFPRWYYSWFATFSRMFPDHLDDCGLEMASAAGKRTINGALIQAMAERWNPRTCTFWFPWGEMTLLMDEFNDIMGLPEPAGQPDDPVEQQFLINIKGVDVREALARATGSRSWPLTLRLVGINSSTCSDSIASTELTKRLTLCLEQRKTEFSMP